MQQVQKAASAVKEYEFGHSDRELKRLATQAQLIDPITRRFFLDAGLKPRMRVLDVGSGAGDVAFLAAEIVGASGAVIGADRSATAIAAAQARAKERSLSNVIFRQGDPAELAFDQPFDAVVGRYVLMFNPDPAAMLKGLARQLKPGGIIVFHEVAWTGMASFPPAPLYDRCRTWIVETFRKVGTNPHMGIDLYATFLRAGLPAPKIGLQALAGAAPGGPNIVDLIADLVVTMAPVMEQHGVATVAEIGAATLTARIRAEADALGSVMVGRYEIGAWSRV